MIVWIKKGFTLVEILAVIVLIALLFGIGVPGVMKISERMKEKSQKTKINLVESAAVAWGEANKSLLNAIDCTIDGKKHKCAKLTVEHLRELDYLDDEINEDELNSKCVFVYLKNNRIYSHYTGDGCDETIYNMEPDNGNLNFREPEGGSGEPEGGSGEPEGGSGEPEGGSGEPEGGGNTESFSTLGVASDLKSCVSNLVVKSIQIVKNYDTTGKTIEKTCDLSANKDGSITGYVENSGTTFTISANGKEKIYANPNSSELFKNYINTVSITGLDLLDTSKVTNMSDMFYRMSIVEEIDVSSFDTSKVTNMSYMFYECKKLKELDISNFDLSNLWTAIAMFVRCESLVSIDVTNDSGWEFNGVHLREMFAYNKNLKEIKGISTWKFIFDEENYYRSFQGMFRGCTSLTELDLSGWNFTKCMTDMDNMFRECTSLEKINLSGINNTYHDGWAITVCYNSNIIQDNMFKDSIKIKEIIIGENYQIHSNSGLYSISNYWYSDDCKQYYRELPHEKKTTYYKNKPSHCY